MGRVVKYVPAEILSAYTLIFSALASMNVPADQGRLVALVLIALFFFVTGGYVWTRTAGSVRTAHLVVSPLAFLAWAYPISSALLGSWFYGVAALLLQALVIGISIVIQPREA